MAKKISDYGPVAALDGSELMEFVQGGANKKGACGAILPSGYIDGLNLQWTSASAINVTSGAAYIPGLGRVLRVNAAIAKTGLALSANTWYHVYLFLNGSTADVEIVSTGPSSPYVGSARAKTGDTSRRYLGSVITDGTGGIVLFIQTGTKVAYSGNPNSRVVSGTTTTTLSSASVALAVPVTASYITLRVAMNATNGAALTVGFNGAGWFNALTPNAVQVELPISAGQLIYYQWLSAPTGGNASLDTIGYTFER
ncbi:MAG: hypothetical protein WBW32_15395 [Luteibacter sp.]